MLRKTITYTNYFGNEVTNDYYFNLTTNDMIEYTSGPKKAVLDAVQKGSASDTDLVEALRDFILAAYGKVSMDGDRFEKSEESKNNFAQSAAFDALFMELAQNGDKLNEFMAGVLPKEMRGKYEVELAKQKTNIEALK